MGKKIFIPDLSALEIVLSRPIHQPLVTEKREWLFKTGIFDVFRVFGTPLDTYIATFGGKNAVIRNDEFLGSYPYHFLTLAHLENFVDDPSIEPSLLLID